MRLYILALLAFCAVAPAAHADYFKWQDPKTGASLTFPDTWRMVNNQQPDDLVTVLGPSQADYPVCRLRARGDNRFTVYPVEYSNPVQDVAYNQKFWEEYTAEYHNVQLHSYRDNANLGRAFASMVMASFATVNDPYVMRTGQMWAGVYHDTAYILDCSSTNASFMTWQGDFVAIAKSVDMRKAIDGRVTGDYPHDFLHDRRPWYQHGMAERGYND
jgi:hypothetical protein